jgi:protein translocase SecG subunit
MRTVLVTTQIIICFLLTGAILLQAKGTGFAGIGGLGSGEFYSSRRGLEKAVFGGTIILAAVFAVLSLALLVLT